MRNHRQKPSLQHAWVQVGVALLLGAVGCSAGAGGQPTSPATDVVPAGAGSSASTGASLQIGASNAAGKYRFAPQKNLLVEGADRLVTLGSTTQFIYLDQAYSKYPNGTTADTDWPTTPPTSAVQIAQNAIFDGVLARPQLSLTTMTVYAVGAPIAINPDEQKEEQQYYELARWLLTRFAGTGKTFILKNWEGDWHLLVNDDTSGHAAVDRARDMIRWFRAKQRGVQRARDELRGHTDVAVYHAVEVNRVVDALDGKLRLANLLPYIGADMVSYSSYDAILSGASEMEMESTLGSATAFLLDQAAQLRKTNEIGYASAFADLPVQPADPMQLGSRRVILGEFAVPENRMASTAEVEWRIRDTLAVASQLKLRAAYYWQLYDNECTDGGAHCPGWFLYRPDGSPSGALRALAKVAGWTVPPSP